MCLFQVFGNISLWFNCLYEILCYPNNDDSLYVLAFPKDLNKCMLNLFYCIFQNTNDPSSYPGVIFQTDHAKLGSRSILAWSVCFPGINVSKVQDTVHIHSVPVSHVVSFGSTLPPAHPCWVAAKACGSMDLFSGIQYTDWQRTGE